MNADVQKTNRKAELLANTVEHVAIDQYDARPVIDAVGGGELEAALKSRALALGVAASINFLGPRSAGWISAEGPAYLGFVAPYCLAPNGDRDTGAVVAREAMMMGLPVVASRLMGLPEATSAIVPIVVGAPGRAMELSRALEAEGFLVGAIRPPTVPEGTARLRVTFTAAHPDAEIERLAAALRVGLRALAA